MKLSNIFTFISASSIILLGLSFISQSISNTNATLNITFSIILFGISLLLAIIFSIIENKKK
jgi:chromate transport protein ChrA